jgi:hypothetical protein
MYIYIYIYSIEMDILSVVNSQINPTYNLPVRDGRWLKSVITTDARWSRYEFSLVQNRSVARVRLNNLKRVG